MVGSRHMHFKLYFANSAMSKSHFTTWHPLNDHLMSWLWCQPLGSTRAPKTRAPINGRYDLKTLLWRLLGGLLLLWMFWWTNLDEIRPAGMYVYKSRIPRLRPKTPAKRGRYSGSGQPSRPLYRLKIRPIPLPLLNANLKIILPGMEWRGLTIWASICRDGIWRWKALVCLTSLFDRHFITLLTTLEGLQGPLYKVSMSLLLFQTKLSSWLSKYVPWWHQIFCSISAVKLLGIMFINKCWSHTITAKDVDRWLQMWW